LTPSLTPSRRDSRSLRKLLSGEHAGAVLLGRAELLADLGDLLAEVRGLLPARFELLLLVGDLRHCAFEIALQLLPLAVERFQFADDRLPPLGQSALLCGDVLALDFDVPDPAVHLGELAHQVENGRLVLARRPC